MTDHRVCYISNGTGVPATLLDRFETRSNVELVPISDPDAATSVESWQALLVGPEVTVEEIESARERTGVFTPIIAVIDDQSLRETEADEAIHERTARECPGAAIDRVISVVESRSARVGSAAKHDEALDRVLAVFSEWLGTVADVHSIGQFAETLCTRLSKAGPYRVVGYYEYDVSAEAVTLCALDGTTEPIDSTRFEAASVRQSALTVVRSGETLLLDPVEDTHLSWEYHPLLLVPVVRAEVPYGVLGVSTDRPGAFGAFERRVLHTFGRVIANVCVTIQQKQTLAHGDTVAVELEIEGTGQYFLDLSDRDDCWAELEGLLVDEESGDTRAFVRTNGSREAIEAQAEDTDWVTSVSIESVEGAERLVELAGSRVPIVESIATHGAMMQQATARSGTARIVFEVPSETTVERLLPLVGGEEGEATLVARQDGSRMLRDMGRFRRVLEQELTDRQHEVLLLAYHSGFFSWPRERSGEDLAESLDIAQPTFHEHLRAAQRTLLETVFEDDRSLYSI
jgi:predicted DNA binding protein